MNGTAPTSYLTGVPGWESFSEQALLVKLAQDVPPSGVIVEIGAEFGMSASLFCYAADPKVTIYSIDLFPGDLMRLHMENLAEAGYATKTPAGIVSRTIVLQGDSAAYGLGWLDVVKRHGRNSEWVDLLFIDGDHSYKGVTADLLAWAGKVRSGGRMAFHDVAQPTNPAPHEQHYEVAAAIRDWRADQPAGAWSEFARVDSILVLERA